MTAFAVVFAVGASLASVLRTPQPIVYDYITSGSTPECSPVTLTCDVSGPKPCKVNINDARTLRQNDNTATQCGDELFRN